MRYLQRSLLALLLMPILAYGEPKQKTVKVQKSSISKDEEIQLGKEAAAQVEREMNVINDPKIEAWLNQIGQKLAQTPQANAYPYYFKLIQDDSINAFALPGGPMFVNTGLIAAADNEAQVAGVLAHEMSHVALRHGVSQMGRTNKWQQILGLAGAAAGMAGGTTGDLIGAAVNTGGAVGVGSLLSKYSRDAERDADLNGARMLAAAGYDPLEMARFFEKLEAELGEEAHPKGLDSWFASHPSPGNRVKAVSEDIRFYSAKQYTADTGQFAEVKQAVANLPPAKIKPGAALQPIQAQPRQGVPKGFTDVQTKDFAIAHPGSWKAGRAQGGGSLFLVPEGGVTKGQSGGVELIAGAMLDYHESANQDLETATKALLQSLQQGDANLKLGASESTNVGGKAAKLTRMTTRTSYAQDPEQIVEMYSVIRPMGLWMLVFAAPKSKFAEAQPMFQQMLQSVVFQN